MGGESNDDDLTSSEEDDHRNKAEAGIARGAVRSMGRSEVAGGIDEKGGEKVSESEDDECEELVVLPPEITKILVEGDRDRVYKSEEELERVLAEAGVGDLRVVLVGGKPRLVIRSDQHNAITSG
jgi:hypothetical protein